MTSQVKPCERPLRRTPEHAGARRPPAIQEDRVVDQERRQKQRELGENGMDHGGCASRGITIMPGEGDASRRRLRSERGFERISTSWSNAVSIRIRRSTE